MEVIKDIEMKTKRLSLRRPNINDKAFFVYLFNAPKVSDTYVCDSLKDEAVVEKWLNERIPNVPYVWVIEYEGRCVGMMNCFESNDASDCMEIGYVIDPKYHNMGICTECLVAVIDFLLDKVGYHKVVSSHFLHNPASGRVMQKAKMWHEGKRYHEFLFRGKYETLDYYYITKVIRKINHILDKMDDDTVLDNCFKLYAEGIIDNIDEYRVYTKSRIDGLDDDVIQIIQDNLEYEEVYINHKLVKVRV